MKNVFQRTLTLCLVAATCCAGCAKHEMVKQDQMIPAVSPAASATPAKAAAQEKAAPAAKDADLDKSVISESPVQAQPSKESAADNAAQAALQSKLEKIFFDFDSPALSPAGRATLVKNAEVLKKQESVKIRIEGNCDELGSDDYNLSLGENRAKSAMNYLVSLGIKPERISIVSYGKEKPAVPGHDDAARAQNRRDEFVVIPK